MTTIPTSVESSTQALNESAELNGQQIEGTSDMMPESELGSDISRKIDTDADVCEVGTGVDEAKNLTEKKLVDDEQPNETSIEPVPTETVSLDESAPTTSVENRSLTQDKGENEQQCIEVSMSSEIKRTSTSVPDTLTRFASFPSTSPITPTEDATQKLARSRSEKTTGTKCSPCGVDLRPTPPTRETPIVQPREATEEDNQVTITATKRVLSGADAVLQTSKELDELLSERRFADDFAVECAERALKRYLSPLIRRRELRSITATEKALEKELLGLDNVTLSKLPEAVNEKLNKRARALAAAETAASNASALVPSTRSSQQASKPDAPEPVTAELIQETSAQSSQGDTPQVTSPTTEDSTALVASTSEQKSEGQVVARAPSMAIVKEQKRNPGTHSKGRQSARKRIDVVDLTAVYDRNYSWLKNYEFKIGEAQRQRDTERMKECSFQPNALLDNKPNRTSTEAPLDENEGTAYSLTRPNSACIRLYQKARELHVKQYEKTERRYYEERQQLLAAAPRARPLPVNVYGSIKSRPASRCTSQRLRSVPTGMEECTFHPKTNVQRKWTSPSETRKKCFWKSVNLGALASEEISFRDNELTTRNSTALQSATKLTDDKSAATGNTGIHDALKRRDSTLDEKVQAMVNRWEGKAYDMPMNDVSEEIGNGASNVIEEGYCSEGARLIRKPVWTSTRRVRLTRYAGAARFLADVDFVDFLKRQEEYLQNRNQRMEARLRLKKAHIKLAPGTRKILRDKKAQLIAARSDADSTYRWTPNQADSISTTPLTSRLANLRSHALKSLDPECSFHPQISKRAQMLGRRSVYDFLRRSDKAIRMRDAHRTEKELEERTNLTFKPRLNKNLQVQSKLNLKDPDAYMASIHRQQEEKRLRLKRAAEEKEAAEMAECTFFPKTSSLSTAVRREFDQRRTQSRGNSVIHSYPKWGYAFKFETGRTL